MDRDKKVHEQFTKSKNLFMKVEFMIKFMNLIMTRDQIMKLVREVSVILFMNGSPYDCVQLVTRNPVHDQFMN